MTNDENPNPRLGDLPSHPLYNPDSQMTPEQVAELMELSPHEKALLVEHGLAQPDPLDLLIVNGQDIKESTYPETEFIVPTVIPEGLTLLAAAPKIGKSWFVLQVAAAVSEGSTIFGGIQLPKPRRVLYMALEESPRRIQKRLDIMGMDYGRNVDFIFDLKANNAADMIAAWFTKWEAQKPIVIVDTYGRTLDGEQDATYSRDYAGMANYKSIIPPGCSLLFVHHTKKADEGDFLQALSGTNGLAGAADTIIVLKRDRLSKDATLSITSREMEEAEHHLNFNDKAVWTIGDRPEPQKAQAGTTGAIVTQVLIDATMALTRAEIAAKAYISIDAASGAIRRLKDQGTIVEVGNGRFTLRNSSEEVF
jgi:ribosomal protein S25